MPFELILYSGVAGITVFLGALLAKVFDNQIQEGPKKEEVIHSLMSFGAGIMLSAVALVLIPKGLEELDVFTLALSFAAGAIIFIDKQLDKSGSQTSTLLAMMMDYIPETIALGALFAVDINGAILLAVFIGLQNLPEAFNSYRDLIHSGFSSKRALILFFAASFIGIIGAVFGFSYLQDLPVVTAALMTFAGGGILYLLVRDIIPESKLDNSHMASLAATLGFLVGVIGEKVIWDKYNLLNLNRTL